MTGREEELAEVARWAEGIEQVHSCIAGRFRRPEPRRRVLDYLRGLVSSVERKNGWQLAEQAGDATPDGVQRLLYNYRWDADLVRDDMKSYVVEHLSAADAVLVVDETGFLKKGEQVGWGAAAVQRDGGADRELSDWRFSGLCQRQGQNPAGKAERLRLEIYRLRLLTIHQMFTAAINAAARHITVPTVGLHVRPAQRPTWKTA